MASRSSQMPGDRRVLLVVDVDRDAVRRAAARPGSAPGLGLPLAEVAPRRDRRCESRACCASVVT